MLQFTNETPFKGTILLAPDADGIDSLFAIVKGTFALGPQLALVEEQLPIQAEEAFHGEPDKSSIRIPSDVSLTKPATDVLLLGTAYAPGGRPTGQMDVSLSVGPIHKQVRVFGDRSWLRTAVGYTISAPAPFEAMPLVWERAFGGTEVVNAEPRAETRNPVGQGFRAPEGRREVDGLPLPNLEDPGNLISSWKQQPAPACFAPVSAHWEPRRSFAGTYDAQWEQERAPFLPTDFDSRFFQLAPPGLTAEGYLRGGELGEIRGAVPNGTLQFQIPPLAVRTTFVVDGSPQVVDAQLDTVVIEPDLGRLIVVWRASLRCDKKALRVNEVKATLTGVA